MATPEENKTGREIAVSEPPDDVDALFEDTLRRVRDYNPSANFERLTRAFEYAKKAHAPHTRASGEPYIFHPVEVARILTGMRMDTPSLEAALLHDVLEDCGVTKVQMSEAFGREVAELVDGVTKLSAIMVSSQQDGGPSLNTRADAQAENLRKIFLAMAKDIRVILIKLADRLHNLRTLGSMPPQKQRGAARETLEIYAPIASRLGLWKIKPELEDLGFQYLYPEEYEVTVAEVGRMRTEREKIIPEVLDGLREKLKELDIEAQIEWRPKHLYSVWQKMRRSEKGIDEIYDLIAVRVVVDTQEDCYTTLGAVHALWMPIKDRIKDYIAVPKSNRYRSLHTTVYGPGNEPLEIQIRTWEMHSVNEFGIAAHWAYKQGKEVNKEINLAQDIYPWIRLILDWQDDSKDAREYIEHLKLDLLTTEVFVFTPRGDVVDLPAGSTPLDFAYRVHTDVGHRCVGAKVNTRMVPLDYQLQNADIVDVITSKNGTPSLDWLRLCKSSHARNKIRAWFKKERRDENISRGKDMLERELKRLRAEQVMSDHDLLLKATRAVNFVTVEDMLAAVGYTDLNVNQVVSKIRELAPDKFPLDQAKQRAPSRKKKNTRYAVSVTGMQDLLIKFSRCCNPVHGDEIAGFISLGRGVAIHRASCKNYEAHTKSHPERAIGVHWEGPSPDASYPVELDIEAVDRSGLVGDLIRVVNDARVPIREQRARVGKNGRASVRLALDIIHKQQLDELMKRIFRVRGVVDVERAASSRS